MQDHALVGPRPFLEALGNLHPAPQVGRGGVPDRDTLQRQRKLSSQSACSLGVDGDGIVVDVGDGVAGKVVAGVSGCTGAGEDAARWYAEVVEADVVGTGSKGSVVVVSIRLWGMLKVILDVLTQSKRPCPGQ